MKLKSMLMLTVFIAVPFVSLCAQSSAYDLILQNFGARNYAAEQIPRADIEKIVAAGVRAPSASNKQPWKFTVVQTKSLADKIIPGMPTGSILVVISSDTGAENNPSLYLDCGLATENIYLAAQALGYGSRIYTGPVRSMGAAIKSELGLAANNSVIAIVRIGKLAAGVDAVTSASPRKNASDVVTYK
jgi:nitroreductase